MNHVWKHVVGTHPAQVIHAYPADIAPRHCEWGSEVGGLVDNERLSGEFEAGVRSQPT